MADDDDTLLLSARRSISLRLIRHAESRNNQVYRHAMQLFGVGTDRYDGDGWNTYIHANRHADCDLSDPVGFQQADNLAKAYLEPLLEDRKSVQVITSPMRRTLATLRPTVERCKDKLDVLVHAEYFETEGCHTKGVAEEGMCPTAIRQFLGLDKRSIEFHGFKLGEDRGWWQRRGSETRAQAELRCARFYMWICEYLDAKLAGEVRKEDENPLHVLIGHGDFMNLLLQRMLSSFGHAVETPGLPHRGAMVHWNTGVTEVEYFGAGRWLILCQNGSSHIPSNLRTGGSLEDGWSYLMPIYFKPEHKQYHVVQTGSTGPDFPPHILEQRQALLSLYLHSAPRASASKVCDDRHFAVCHQNQLLAVATTYCETGSDKATSSATTTLVDVAMRPSAAPAAMERFWSKVSEEIRTVTGAAMVVQPATAAARDILASAGFRPVGDDEDSGRMELRSSSLTSKI